MLKPHQFVRTLFASLVASLSFALAAVAAEAGTGTIEGRVQNARTGEYVERARLQLASTTQETFTDADGFYRFPRVAPGEVKIEAFFTGLPPETIRITVAPGVTVQRDIVFGGVAAAERDSTVKLAEFVVGASREMAASAIAINEQRFAPNIKNVLATDEFGFVPEGNAAEFLKFLPGITIESSGGNSREVSINGAPAANVPITVEASRFPAALPRIFPPNRRRRPCGAGRAPPPTAPPFPTPRPTAPTSRSSRTATAPRSPRAIPSAPPSTSGSRATTGSRSDFSIPIFTSTPRTRISISSSAACCRATSAWKGRAAPPVRRNCSRPT